MEQASMMGCEYCGPYVMHIGVCPRVAEIRRHPDGTVTHVLRDPLEPVIPTVKHVTVVPIEAKERIVAEVLDDVEAEMMMQLNVLKNRNDLSIREKAIIDCITIVEKVLSEFK